jgi:hypothetical protein
MSKQRTLTEAEARGLATLFWLSTNTARITVAQWNLRKGAPKKDELMELAMLLKEVTDIAAKITNGPPTDGHLVDDMIDCLEKHIERLTCEPAA